MHTGLAVIVAAVLVRLTLPFEPMPYWDADPSVLYSPSSAIGPAHSLMLDVLAWLGAAVGLAGSSGVFARRWVLAALLATMGSRALVARAREPRREPGRPPHRFNLGRGGGRR